MKMWIGISECSPLSVVNAAPPSLSASLAHHSTPLSRRAVRSLFDACACLEERALAGAPWRLRHPRTCHRQWRLRHTFAAYLKWLGHEGKVKHRSLSPYLSVINTVHNDLGFPGPARGGLVKNMRQAYSRKVVYIMPPPRIFVMPSIALADAAEFISVMNSTLASHS